MEWLSRLHRKRCYITWSMTSQQEGHSQVKVITFANSPLTWKALPISLIVPPSCNFKQALGEWTNHLHPNLPLVRGTSKRNKGINCCIDFCKLQSFCLMLEWEKWWNTTLHLSTWPIHTGFSTRTMQSNTWKEHIGMTRLLVQHLLYHSKGEMLRWEQSKGHGKGTRSKSSLPI